MKCQHQNQLGCISNFDGGSLVDLCIECIKKEAKDKDSDFMVSLPDILPYIKETGCLKEATDLCQRIMALSKLAVDAEQTKQMLDVLIGMGEELKAYEEVFE